MGASAYFDIQSSQIKTPGNGLIIFQGMQSYNADSVKSLESFDIAWIEEGQNLSDKSLTILRPTIRQPGSEIWAGWNPRFKTDAIDKFLRSASPPADSVVVKSTYKDNPWFPFEVLGKEVEWDRDNDPDKYAHVWLGDYVKHSEARVFQNWRIDEFEAPPDAIHRFGADWGFSTDPSVLIRSHIIGRTIYIDYEAYRLGCEVIDLPDFFDTIPESRKWPIIADSSRPETISHLRKHGFPRIYKSVKGAGSVEEGVEWLKSYEIVVHVRCKHTIDELTLFSYKIDADSGFVLPVLADRDNHLIDALRYSHEGHRRAEKSRAQSQHAGAGAPRPTNNPMARR